MVDRNNHYERAFGAYLRLRRVPCLPVEESRRSIAERPDAGSIKSPDFIVCHPLGALLLIDVKGRRGDAVGRTLENWVTIDDIDSLKRWEKMFGGASRALLTFVYHLSDAVNRVPFEDRFTFADRHYGCVGVPVADYARHMRLRSPRWMTVNVPQVAFWGMARPLSHWFEKVEGQ